MTIWRVQPIHSLKDGYSEVNLRTPALSIRRYTKKIEYYLDIQQGQTIIDFGCGDGAVTQILAKAYPDSKFIGVDYSEELIEYAKKNNQRENIKYISANLEVDKLPIDDESIDKIFSWGVMYYIHPVNSYQTYQSEFFRTLKLQGRIFHFQIPLRYGCICRQVDADIGKIKTWLRNIKKNIMDLRSCNINEYSYKYSIRDLMRNRSQFSAAQIIHDDFFLERISILYTK